MTPRRSFTLLLGLVLVLAGVIWWTSQDLPPVVATHYSLNGVADDFSPRGVAVAFWVGVVIGLPLFMAVVPAFLFTLVGKEALKIPHRDYWLEPERKTGTLAYLYSLHCGLCAATALFVVYAHGLDLQANRSESPELSSVALFAGVAALFSLFVVVQMLMNRRFKKLPPAAQV